MDQVEKEKMALISGIEMDARTESEKILQEAQDKAAEKIKYANKKAQSILKDAQNKADAQVQAVKRKVESEVKLEIKRAFMSTQEQFIHNITDAVENKFRSMISEANYRNVLVNWATEAAIGLGADSASVNASQQERELIDNQFLRKVEENVRRHTDKSIKLVLSDEMPLKYQGIALTSADGRIAFNNQVKTRLSRKQREINRCIYNSLFDGNRKE